MKKSRFFHRFLTGSPRNNHIGEEVAKYYRYAGYSVYVERQEDGTLNVTHTFCGRKEKNFSKKKAREMLRNFVAQGKNTVNITLKDLPEHLAKLRNTIYPESTSAILTGADVDELRMAFKFVEY